MIVTYVKIDDEYSACGCIVQWTDDLPICRQSGIGYQTSRNHRVSGGRTGDYEDRSFHIQCPDDCYLYGIIDGHGGSKVANFTVQKLPAELLLGQLKDEYTDEEVCLKLQEAFESVAKGFVGDLINEFLVEKMNLEEQMPENMTKTEAFRRFPSLFQRLKELDAEIDGGCSAVIALIHKSKLYVANVGDARALLCRVEDHSKDLGVVQLSTDHTISTNSELQRLDKLGLDIEKLQVSGILETTRSLGDWALKDGYKNIELLSSAKEEPILSTPSVHGGEALNNSMQFLVLMSKGVYKAYEEATGVDSSHVNQNIACMIRDEILRQTTIEGVAQSVVDQICRLHLNQYVKSDNRECLRRDDMTLLVRLFNIRLGEQFSDHVTILESEPAPIAKKAPNLTLIMPVAPPRPPKPSPRALQSLLLKEEEPLPPLPQIPPIDRMKPLSVVTTPPPFTDLPPSRYSYDHEDEIDDEEDDEAKGVFHGFTDEEQRNFFHGQQTHNINDSNAAPLLIPTLKKNVPNELITGFSESTGGSNASVKTESSGSGYCSMEDKTKLFNRPAEPLETDANGRIKAYVDFSEFTTKINAMGGERVVFAQFAQGSKLI